MVLVVDMLNPRPPPDLEENAREYPVEAYDERHVAQVVALRVPRRPGRPAPLITDVDGFLRKLSLS